MRTFDDSIIEGAAVNFLAGRSRGSLAPTLMFEDFLTVRVIDGSDERGARFPVSFEVEKPATEPINWPAITLAAIGVGCWLAGRLLV